MTLIRLDKYNFKHGKERLIYLGKFDGWHQFALVGETKVWCEVLDEDLHMIEATENGKQNKKAARR